MKDISIHWESTQFGSHRYMIIRILHIKSRLHRTDGIPVIMDITISSTDVEDQFGTFKN